MTHPIARELSRISLAVEASWRPDTAFLGVHRPDNPALGQCYPTARVIQHFVPAAEIVEGTVRTPHGFEKHFWNLLAVDGKELLIDFTWRQFPAGSTVENWRLRDRTQLNDSPETIRRVELLLARVHEHLKT